jgi:membrane peptidoglycan carboxypeptidase
LRRIAAHFAHAAVAAEDARFFHHHGIDWVELRKVLAATWSRGELGWSGSTITQQLVKNLVQDVEQHLQVDGPWPYALSDLYYTLR